MRPEIIIEESRKNGIGVQVNLGWVREQTQEKFIKRSHLR